MCGETGAGALAESCGAAAPFPGPMGELGNSGTCAYSRERRFAERGAFPMFSVRVVLPTRDRCLRSHQGQQQCTADNGYPHTDD